MNMNGRILERNEPPYNILSTAGLINTSGNITTNASVVNLAESNNAIGSISVSGVQASNNDRLVGHFTSENVFNLSHKVLRLHYMMKTLISSFFTFLLIYIRELEISRLPQVFFKNIKMRPKYNKKCYNH